jgi:hypothetical protein
MNFKNWLEHEIQPQEGDWIVIKKDLKSDDVNVNIPAGNYFIFFNNKQYKMYFLKRKPSEELYQISYDYMDKIINNKQAIIENTEHEMYPLNGNWIIVTQNVKAAALGSLTLPAGNYLVVNNDEEKEIYTLKQKPSNKIYQVFYNDMDQMMKDNQARQE